MPPAYAQARSVPVRPTHYLCRVMKYLVAGLGNVGAEYERTRHNIGFEVADLLVKEAGGSWRSDRHAAVAEIKVKGRTLVVIKPTTYMNLSGKAVQYWLQKEKIPVEHLMVVTDDLNLAFGKQRLRGKGSDGGHNGLKDIQATLNTDAYARLRVGIGREFGRGQQVDYVLGKWSSEETTQLLEVVAYAADTVRSFASIGLERTMNFFNKK